MRFLLFSHLENARNSLRSHRSRSLLTMVGITIGVASITTILALSVGATGIIQKQVDELGGNIAIIRPGTQQLTNTNQYSSSTLTENDMLSIAMVEHVIAAAPLMLLTGAVIGDEQATPGTPIVATTPALADINQLVVRDGQFLDTSINRDTAVIGAQLSIDLFGSE